ncbi:uncharacterized protein CC84DRAFT_1220449 [Paraphaeosphaeria sporulosa]|uniref:Uncharacterized protein n=1 Tax=Paraphaeosphaeria sporulosa TaxID=1460663 RepID=A0A177C3N1_9PLEO|nr:uncharacterized protein CC84DRAFT_1220449 [Paraphaeosphaeria sporulosa]OAG02085.1 hypothetical protein CC84DRAFT_1220449 [Paraphaeosphaeria sporulosa]
MVKCPECGAGADLTKDGLYAHCASCNTIFEPNKEGSHYKGSGSGSGDKDEPPKDSQPSGKKDDGEKSGSS